MTCDPQKPMDFNVFQCLRGRRARRREDNRRENGANNKRRKSEYTNSKMMVFWPPSAHLNDTAQNGLPELPREPPGSCRGPFREAQEGPKRRQGRPKTAPRAAKSAPRAPQELSKRPKKGVKKIFPFGWALGGGPGRPPGAISAQFWTLRGPFSSKVGKIF